MKLARTKNAIRNIKAGLLNKIICLLCPFVVRTVFIRTLGAEYLGVSSLFTSILNVLSISELGFSSAIVFHMYKAIADNDDDLINALLFFYRRVYRYVGCITFFVGAALIPFLPNLVKESYPDDINPTLVYLIFLLNSSAGYFLFAYKQALINAFQRNDINSHIETLKAIFTHAAQVVILLCVKNYYVYIAVLPTATILSNIWTGIEVKKRFPQYKPVGKLSAKVRADIREKVSGLLIQNVCVVSRNTFDSIFISAFLGLVDTAIYGNYFMIITSITGVMTILTSAIHAGVGNSVASETREKNYRDMMKMNFMYMWLSGWCTVCLLCLVQQFMEMWAGKDLLLPMSSVILFCMYFYTLKMGDIRSEYSTANGLWWRNRYRALAEAVTNIVLNYFLGKRFGINGIIAATEISLFLINFCYGSQIVYKYYFTEQKMSVYFKSHAYYAAVTALVCAATFALCSLLPNTFVFFLIRMAICLIVPNLLYYFIYRNTRIYKEAIPWVADRIKTSRT